MKGLTVIHLSHLIFIEDLFYLFLMILIMMMEVKIIADIFAKV